MVGHNVRRQGCVRSHSYSLAVAKLQEMGYTTELWVSKKGGLALCWYDQKEQWSVTATGVKKTREALSNIGDNVYRWVRSIESGLGTEQNYAVREV